MKRTLRDMISLLKPVRSSSGGDSSKNTLKDVSRETLKGIPEKIPNVSPETKPNKSYLLAINMNFGAGEIPTFSCVKEIEGVLEAAESWYRVSERLWIIKTPFSASSWIRKLSEITKPTNSLLIVRLDPSDYQGRMSDTFWNWLKKNNK